MIYICCDSYGAEVLKQLNYLIKCACEKLAKLVTHVLKQRINKLYYIVKAYFF